ncbi:hypothetical protein [Mucilaginibacter glaciei]|uniref:Uncharacterized protein n=1 Tax=Mucilaginibacter glaciei TaxID=2772109 RepID=A0A926NMS0_9SPHI|nr:hypothetical protein [Mucilaginibacter glaciei]MBD1391757.1 hypothetical protein [Mucilaginibacter glaciei]
MRIITLSYRKVIDCTADKTWDKMFFNDSYLEFKMQAQNYTQGTQITSYAELIRTDPNANKLAGMITPAITGYIQQLQNVVPDILNNSGRRFLRFNRFQLEIINSDIYHRARHQIELNFYTEPLVWHDTIGNFMLVSDCDAAGEEVRTNLFELQPFLNIYTIKQQQ